MQNPGMLIATRIVMVAVAALTLGADCGNSPPARPVRLTTGSWPPYMDPELPDGGPVTEIVRETMVRLGYQPLITFESTTDWQPVRESVVRPGVLAGFGFTDFAFKEAKDDESYENVVVSKDIVSFEYVLWCQQSREAELQRRYREKKLAGAKICNPGSYALWPGIKQAGAEFVKCDEGPNGAFRTLKTGGADFVVDALRVAEERFRRPESEFPVGDFVVFTLDGEAVESFETSLHLATTSDREAFLEDFDQQLERVKTTPLMKRAKKMIDGTRTPVEILPEPGHGQTTAWYDPSAHGAPAFLPAGSRAVVIEWPARFDDGNGLLDVYKLKLLNGPREGRVVFVEARYVRMLP